MFNTDQKRTLRIALAAVVVGFLISMFGGCDGSGTTEPEQVDSGAHSDTLAPTTNPCATAPGCTLATCGWDRATNHCYDTYWCESSVPSTNINSYAKVPTGSTQQGIYERPASAVCPAGTSSYTYPAGKLMLWGPGVPGSAYSTNPSSPSQAGNDGFICAPYADTFAVSC